MSEKNVKPYTLFALSPEHHNVLSITGYTMYAMHLSQYMWHCLTPMGPLTKNTGTMCYIYSASWQRETSVIGLIGIVELATSVLYYSGIFHISV